MIFLTEQEIKDLLEEWVKDYCRNDFSTGLPAGVKLFLEKGFDYLIKNSGKNSESLGDYSVSFQNITNQLPASVISFLHPYRRMGVPK